MADATYKLYVDKGGEHRWKLVSNANGQALCSSGEGFSSEQSARDNIDRVKAQAADADVDEE